MARVDVVVIGGGVAGLTVARDCAVAGLSTLVIERAERPGGLVARGDLGGLTVDIGAESFAVRGGHVRTLLSDLGLAEHIVPPSDEGAWILSPRSRRRRHAVRIPRRTVMGMPARLWARDVRRVVGWAGSMRASLDLIMPRRVGTDAPNLAALVRARLGSRVLERLVTPLCLGVYSASPAALALDTVAPAVADARARSRSLSRAVRAVAPHSRAGSAVSGIEGGMYELVEALVSSIAMHGGSVLTGRGATSVEIEGGRDGGFLVGMEPGGVRIETSSVRARTLVVAVPLATAGTLLSSLVAPESLGATEALSVEVVTLALHAPVLDSRPRGTGVIVAPGVSGVEAKALTHSTAKWAWLAGRAGTWRHIVRLSYDRPAHAPALDDDEVRATAVRDVSAILGVPLTVSQVSAMLRTPWVDAVVVPSAEVRSEVERWRSEAARVSRLEVVGSGVAGTGLATVVPDARACAERIIRGTMRG